MDSGKGGFGRMRTGWRDVRAGVWIRECSKRKLRRIYCQRLCKIMQLRSAEADRDGASRCLRGGLKSRTITAGWATFPSANKPIPNVEAIHGLTGMVLPSVSVGDPGPSLQ